ncbi:MAG TPA: NAD(P)/FAD-dependent oxidoreductase [Ilumatobacter sp.]|nr:NAD(P)/FAD-dependent oxidoreductase [Ilumatobacter sp.]
MNDQLTDAASTLTWDCIVVGGAAAGLSAALMLGRARRRTLVIDAGAPSNLHTHGIGGLLGHDGRPPSELYEQGRKELQQYPTVEVRPGLVTAGATESSPGSHFRVTLADGSVEHGRTVLLATGADYRYPDIDGIAERWGVSVFHCPFCHGWEVRDLPLGVLDNGPTGFTRAQMLTYWTGDVTLYTNGASTLDEEHTERLASLGVTIEERNVATLAGEGTALDAVVLDDGTHRTCSGLLAAVALHQRSGLAEQFGAELNAMGPVAPEAIQVDPMFQTNVPGLFSAGDASTAMPSIAGAIAAGSTAAAMIVHFLLARS